MPYRSSPLRPPGVLLPAAATADFRLGDSGFAAAGPTRRFSWPEPSAPQALSVSGELPATPRREVPRRRRVPGRAPPHPPRGKPRAPSGISACVGLRAEQVCVDGQTRGATTNSGPRHRNLAASIHATFPSRHPRGTVPGAGLASCRASPALRPRAPARLAPIPPSPDAGSPVVDNRCDDAAGRTRPATCAACALGVAGADAAAGRGARAAWPWPKDVSPARCERQAPPAPEAEVDSGPRPGYRPADHRAPPPLPAIRTSGRPRGERLSWERPWTRDPCGFAALQRRYRPRGAPRAPRVAHALAERLAPVADVVRRACRLDPGPPLSRRRHTSAAAHLLDPHPPLTTRSAFCARSRVDRAPYGGTRIRVHTARMSCTRPSCTAVGCYDDHGSTVAARVTSLSSEPNPAKRSRCSTTMRAYAGEGKTASSPSRRRPRHCPLP